MTEISLLRQTCPVAKKKKKKDAQDLGHHNYYLYFCTLIHNEETLSGSLLVELEFGEIRMEAMTSHPLIAICGDSLY